MTKSPDPTERIIKALEEMKANLDRALIALERFKQTYESEGKGE